MPSFGRLSVLPAPLRGRDVVEGFEYNDEPSVSYEKSEEALREAELDASDGTESVEDTPDDALDLRSLVLNLGALAGSMH